MKASNSLEAINKTVSKAQTHHQFDENPHSRPKLSQVSNTFLLYDQYQR